MDSRPFVYVIYIATTPEQLWRALTDGKFTREYWGGRSIECAWEKGAPFVMRKADGSDEGTKGEVLEIDPPKKLVLSWRFGGGLGGPATTVTFTIAPASPQNVRLMIVHEPGEGGAIPEMAREGWSAILSSLKSFLETGQALEATRRWAASGR